MTARQPILVGVGQLTNRAGDPGEVIDAILAATCFIRFALS